MKKVFDVESSRFPDGSPYRASSYLVSFATYYEKEKEDFSYYTDADFTQRIRSVFEGTTLLIGVNLKFDIGWYRRYGGTIPMGCRIWDCQLAEFILSGQTNSFASMDSLCRLYGLPDKQGGLEEYWDQGIETKDIPLQIVKDYNIGDCKRTWLIYQAQLKDPRMTPELHKLILLQGADLLVLQDMEQNGFKYNAAKSLEKGGQLQQRLQEIEDELNELVKCPSFNWNSGYHLSAFLYGGKISEDVFEVVRLEYKSGPRKGQAYERNKHVETKVYDYPGLFKPLPKTELKLSTPENKLYETNEPVLRQLPCRNKLQKHVIDLILERAEIAKLIDTYLLKLPQRMIDSEWGGVIHGTYNQCVARTGRLSSSAPNMQNIPILVDNFFESRYSD